MNAVANAATAIKEYLIMSMEAIGAKGLKRYSTATPVIDLFRLQIRQLTSICLQRVVITHPFLFLSYLA